MADAGDYRLLDCLGYVETKGRNDDEETDVDCFDTCSLSAIPSLRTRFSLARQLANALYQLQCSNWLHRNLSSHQTVFFRDRDSGALRLDAPYLIGFQYSRPDDNKRRPMKVISSEGISRDTDCPELYLPAEFSTAEPRRYRRSDDVYSLGVVLLEIAYWEPVRAFHEEYSTTQETACKLLEMAATQMPSEVGELYSDAVVRCLRGLRLTASGLDGEARSYDGTYRGEDPEFGLEVDFLWKVLREIEKCRV
ncbi:hypothetical protein C8A00DRAFT_34510 [Chaetomidium leptoderma]|uniref:DUF7580 domain-containing protein n=1 Tax=Chaetomidium leptoderma TaxID=669021 RepID=A0AAN6VK85_9PEZI|nr:hypothetical protein C8A00DRAFT_34510 [Chaetomidium leptoderma]